MGSNPEALAEIIKALEQKVEYLSGQKFTAETVE